MPLRTESGRARYIYSNTHGVSCCCVHWLLTSSSSSVMIITSPGCTSLTLLNPIGPKAQSSDATHHSGPSGVSRVPRHNGRIPKGSRNATKPTPRTRHMHAYAPFAFCRANLHLRADLLTAEEQLVCAETFGGAGFLIPTKKCAQAMDSSST
jgi:hypothetical protein